MAFLGTMPDTISSFATTESAITTASRMSTAMPILVPIEIVSTSGRKPALANAAVIVRARPQLNFTSGVCVFSSGTVKVSIGFAPEIHAQIMLGKVLTSVL